MKSEAFHDMIQVPFLSMLNLEIACGLKKNTLLELMANES